MAARLPRRGVIHDHAILRVGTGGHTIYIMIANIVGAALAAGVALLGRVCPSPLPAEWWIETCAEVDVTSVRVGSLMQTFSVTARILDQAVLESAVWLEPALMASLHICKVNAAAGLSARPTMSIWSVLYAFSAATAACEAIPTCF